MPNALVEAMLCGVPVLSTDCPSGPSEILQGGQLGGLVPVENPSALAAAIDDAITNHPQWQQRSAEARTQIVERYSAESGIERVTALFEKAVNRFQEQGR
ncbi:MAG: glycosyltransferase, partial [Planctomycetaceae bacterium]|nr:glycosyltransferase [Planctomycetaceae bacterium]